ncbi:NAD(P)-dependent oxidoreductase [Roseomonas sp. CECT 9278]|uniref:NAD-dependent epimerase/dehydratase family protein n=1 Tax=Roseomonas sp. CECT 9278 TaxID=2845823 RepID=UPI001E4F4A54|nr:NAD(P)-dependent oxidoreductase [Roseomonas sp. CECT 9278]CAH0286308.1 GDP-6-deoxy-D-mannose reductase [Roseomonas sp. CECT 9278]
MEPSFDTALVTGGRGFLGRGIVAALRGAGWRVATIGAARRGDAADHVAVAGPSDAEGIAAALVALRPALVVHLAAAAPGAPPEDHEAVTVAGTRALLAALSGQRAPPVLLAFGSAAEFGPIDAGAGPLPESWPCAPSSPHGRAKHAASLAVQRYLAESGAPGAVLRLFTAAGPGAPAAMLLGRIAAEIAAMPPAGGAVRVAGPERERDYLPVTEVARLVMRLAPRARELPALLHLCSGRGIAVREWIAALAAARGVPVTVLPRQDGARRDDPARVVGDPGLLRALGLAPAAFDLATLAREIMAPWRG